MKNRIEQNRCCEASLRIFEGILGRSRTKVCFPDIMNRRDMDIDMRANVGTTKLAIEHTLIEPFKNFRKSDHDFGRFMTMLDPLIPTSSVPTSCAFRLLMHRMAFDRANKKRMNAVAKAVAEFAIENMALLANPPPQDHSIPSSIVEGIMAARHGDIGASRNAWQQLKDLRFSQRPPMSIRLEFDGVGATLEIMPSPRPSQLGTLRIVRAVENIETKRRDRVMTALADNKKKLEIYRSRGYRTVLILESDDIALTSDHAVFEALSAALSCVDVAADDIFFADTCTVTYALSHLVINGQKSTRWYAAREFDANALDGEPFG